MNADSRFLAKLRVCPSGCWVWVGALNSAGYARFWNGTTGVYGHRWAYERFVEPIPSDCDIDHRCRNTRCVNPCHLRPLPHSVNVTLAYAAKGQTHCKRGHDLAAAYKTKDGRRDCRKCRAARTEEVEGYNVVLPPRSAA